MRIKNLFIYPFLLFLSIGFAQKTTKLDLKEALDIAVRKSNEAVLASTKVQTKNLELQSVKNIQYPDMKLSGQYLRLTNANVNLKLNSNSSSSSNSSPKVNELMLGQANVNFPIFNGFKLKNTIIASENLFKSEEAKYAHSKEEIAIKVVDYYANLYRTQKAVEFLSENLKSAKQRVTDFINLENNGIIPRNDLLKVQLQQSKLQLSLDEAVKNVSILNFYLVTYLHLPEDFYIGIDENQFDGAKPILPIENNEIVLKNRKDLLALTFIKKANESGIKIAKSNYFPSLALVGGYTALSLQNVVSVTNAMNFGVGVSYNFSSVFKNKKEVQLAKSKVLETEQAQAILTENIKIQVQQAIENFNLSKKQSLVYKEAIDQAFENFRIVKDKHENGLATTNELLEADVEQLNAKINFANSRANIMLKYYEMLAASGTLLASFNL